MCASARSSLSEHDNEGIHRYTGLSSPMWKKRNARNKHGETPIFTTVDNDAIPLFNEHGADLTIRDNKGKTVMETAKEKGPPSTRSSPQGNSKFERA